VEQYLAKHALQYAAVEHGMLNITENRGTQVNEKNTKLILPMFSFWLG